MSDSIALGLIRDAKLLVGTAIASELCRRAQDVHRLGTTSGIALGRLMIATVLAAQAQRASGSLSLQVVARGRLQQIFADVNTAGDVRGFVRPHHLAMPPLTAAERHGRRAIGHAVGHGVLSMIRIPEDQNFSQSSTELVSGEIDTDVESFLARSDQIPSALSADVLLGDDDRVRVAGGVLVQAMPGADMSRLEGLRTELAQGQLTTLLTKNGVEALDLLRTLFPAAAVTEPRVEFRWKCRCSEQRVLAALAMLDPGDLAEMATQKEPTTVGCDFCGSSYTITPAQVRRVFEGIVKAAGNRRSN
ncbi:MAG: Hsp33 family molecular chaperone HslO [Deltaproteobacteria bacterium]|nr:Hsp33 family molecular chaperone HslO [Deltaproteobacteria bacterium]